MIIQVNVKNGNDGKKVAILFPFGSYRVDFGHKKSRIYEKQISAL